MCKDKSTILNNYEFYDRWKEGFDSTADMFK
ncbi:hypothetical protein JOC70_003417 [Clostridium pascui]|nr:hypothetical protein [Clostridium pascui]